MAPEKLNRTTDPEVLLDMSPADLWAAAASYLELLTGEDAFFWLRDMEQLKAGFRSTAALSAQMDCYYGDCLPPAALSFFKRVFEVDPLKRPSVHAALTEKGSYLEPAIKRFEQEAEQLR